MKKSFSLFLILVFISNCSARKEEKRLINEIDSLRTQLENHEDDFKDYKALKRLRKNKEELRDVIWYRNSFFKHYANTNKLSILIGNNHEEKWLRMKISYGGERPIYFRKVYLLYDDKIREITPEERYTPAQNSDGTFWESVNIPISSKLKKYLREFANSSGSKVKLSGKFSVARKVTSKEKKGIIEVLNAFRALKK